MQRVLSLCSSAALLLACSMLTGCATILGGGSHEPVSFASNTPDTKVRIVDNDRKEIVSQGAPCVVTLKRGGGYFSPAKYTAYASAPGQPERAVPVKAGFNGWYVGNIVFGGLIGLLVVDPLTGAMWDLPDKVQIDFNKPPPGPNGTAALGLNGTPTGEHAGIPYSP